VFRSEEIILSLSPFQGQEDHIIYWIRLAIYVVFQMHPLDDKVTTIVFFSLRKTKYRNLAREGCQSVKKVNIVVFSGGRRGEGHT
jgi:hypothetical protein